MRSYFGAFIDLVLNANCNGEKCNEKALQGENSLILKCKLPKFMNVFFLQIFTFLP